MQKEKELSVQICGLHRTLAITDTGCGRKRLSLRLEGDVALTNVSAGALATKLARLGWDLLAGPAPECLPLLQVLSTFLGREHYLALYRNAPPSMNSPLTTTGANDLFWFLDGRTAEHAKDQRVILIADAITSEATLQGAETLIEQAGGRVVGYAAILVSPPIARWEDLLFLNELPEIP